MPLVNWDVPCPSVPVAPKRDRSRRPRRKLRGTRVRKHLAGCGGVTARALWAICGARDLKIVFQPA